MEKSFPQCGKLLGLAVVLGAGVAGAQNPPYRAPLYWSVYENLFEQEKAGRHNVHLSEADWRANIAWVDRNLKDHGYTMVCIDGWGDLSQLNSNGYRRTHSRHWQHDYAWWSAHLQMRGMTLGMYGNPLWVHVGPDDAERTIVGTDLPVASLLDPAEDARFPWVQVDRPGAEEYVKGWIHYYADLGVKFYRIDFLSWYEDGRDLWEGRVGPERPREHYETALRWMREAADERGVFLSFVMPHLYHDAAAERATGHMIRINEDTAEGGWTKWSDWFRGQRRPGWSAYGNAFDGLAYWSRIAGRGRVILDPDFIRLNTFATAAEKMSVVSLCLLAGGPVAVADQHDTIGGDLWVYLNPELLELNRDGFVGQPLSPDPLQEESQVWFGQLSGGDWIVGLFNRENEPRIRYFNFAALGFAGSAEVRDLWAHENLGAMDAFRAELPPRSCRILRVVPPGSATVLPPAPTAMAIAALELLAAPSGAGGFHAEARVRIADTAGRPVANAEVQAAFGASFAETVSARTDGAGLAVLRTRAAAASPVQLHVAVTHVRHPRLAYLGHRNAATTAGALRYVAGTFNRWRPQAMRFARGQWRAESVLIAAGDHRLKFSDTRDFSGDDWGAARGLAGTVSKTTGGRPDVRFHVPQTALYDISFDPDTLEYALQPARTQTLQKQMYVAGSFARWTIQPMQFDGARWTLPAAELPAGRHELKFLNTRDFSGDDWGAAEGLAGTAAPTTGGGPNVVFEVETGGPHAIAFHDLSGAYLIRPAP